MANTEARAARDNGIATASNRADRIDPTWRERAYNALVEHAKTHPTFTIEQLRAAAGPTLEDPPSLRAWGGVAQRAQKSGILEHHGWIPSENPACHTGEVRVWASRICRSAVTAATDLQASLVRGSEVRLLREEVAMLRGLLEEAWAFKDGEACSDGCCGGCCYERIEMPAVLS